MINIILHFKDGTYCTFLNVPGNQQAVIRDLYDRYGVGQAGLFTTTEITSEGERVIEWDHVTSITYTTLIPVVVDGTLVFRQSLTPPASDD